MRPRSSKWDGPTTGPKVAKGKTIVVLAGDMKNGGILGVTKASRKPRRPLGWTVRTLDGAGSIGGRTAAFGQAMALKPDGIIIDGFDAVEQKPAMEAAKAARHPDGLLARRIAVIGPVPEAGVFANVTTDADGSLQRCGRLGLRRCRRQAGRRHLHRLRPMRSRSPRPTG